MPLLFTLLACVAADDSSPGKETSDTGDTAGIDTADSTDSGDTTDTTDTAETGETADSGEDSGDPTTLAPLGLTVTPAPAVQTVLVASWTTAAPCVGSASFAYEARPDTEVAEAAATTSHRVLLLGIPSEMPVSGAVQCVDGDLVGPRQAFDATTGPLPEGLTDLTLRGDPDPRGGFLTLPILVPVEAATIIDMQGRIVWYWFETTNSDGTRVHLSVDTASVLVNVQDESPNGTSGQGGLRRVSFDGSTVERISVPQASHDYVELPDGTIAAIAADIRKDGKDSYHGDRIMEVAPDGTLSELWSVWDIWTPATAPPEHTTGAASWTHGNAVDYDPVTDSYWFSLRNLSAIVHIDRASGAVLEQIGGPTPTWTYTDPAQALDGEHQFQLLDDGILVFDNQYTSRETRAVEYAMDAASHTLDVRWSYLPSAGFFEQALGDVHRNDDGSTRVTFSTEGEIHQVDGDGNLLWVLTAGPDATLGYTEHIATLYGSPPVD